VQKIPDIYHSSSKEFSMTDKNNKPFFVNSILHNELDTTRIKCVEIKKSPLNNPENDIAMFVPLDSKGNEIDKSIYPIVQSSMKTTRWVVSK
jgi:hypothetical protein